MTETKQEPESEATTRSVGVERVVRCEAALEIVYWNDWYWASGLRQQGEYSRLAGAVLGMGPLPSYWPTAEERSRISHLHAICGT